VLPADADVAATNPTVLDQPTGDIFGRVHGDGETNPLGRQDHGRVHAYHFSARVDQRAAGIARIQRGIGLENVVHEPAGLGTERPAERADHTGGHRALEAVRVADGDSELADADALRF